VQQEGSPLEWREPLQRQHQRQGHVLLDLFLHDGFGKPGTDIGFALVPRGFQLIEAEPGHDPAQECLRLAHRAAVGLHPADEGLLQNVLRIGQGAEHAVGDALQLRPQRVERHRSVIPKRQIARHAAAALRLAFTSAGSTQRPKPTARRFQPLMTLIIRVSFTCSSSLNCAFRAS